MIQLIGKQLSVISSQLIGFLQLAMEDRGIYRAALEAMSILVTTADKADLEPYILPMSIHLLKTKELAESEDIKPLVSVFEYILNVCPHIQQEFILQLKKLIPESTDWNRCLQVLSKKSKVLDQPLLERIAAMESYLRNDSAIVVEQAVECLKQIFLESQVDLQELLNNDTLHGSLKEVVKQLMELARKHASNDSLGPLIAECLGIIGPVDPARMDIEFTELNFSVTELDLSSNESVFQFFCSLVEHYLVSSFHAIQSPQLQSILGYTIQEIIRWCGFSSEIIETARASKGDFRDAENPHKALLVNRWLKFSKRTLATIEPFVGSRYHINPLTHEPKTYPIYKSLSSFSTWIRTWCVDLVHRLPEGSVKRLFTPCVHAILSLDEGLAQMLVPHLMLNNLLKGDLSVIQDVLTEFNSVLTISGNSSISEYQQVCIQVFKFLYLDNISSV
jgi:serine/threonine-protein kinase ATR